MKKILFGFLAVIYSIPAVAITVSGKVVDTADEPLAGATVFAPGTSKGITANSDGVFDDDIDVEADTELEISYVGCTPQKFKASELKDKTIKLNCENQIDAVVITDDFKSRACNEQELSDANATAGKTVSPAGGGKIYCNPSACKCGYDLDKSDRNKQKCVAWPENKECTNKTTPKLPRNAKSAKMVCESDVAVCKIESCDGVEFELDDNKCEKTTGKECTADDANAVKAKSEKRNNKMVCVIKKCTDKYVPADDGLSCVLSEGDCTPEELAALDAKATKGKLKKQKCIITECTAGYVPEGDKCVEVAGDCADTDLPENATYGHIKYDATTQSEVCLVDGCKAGFKPSDDKLSCVEDADAQQKIEDAREKYEAAKENEQSLANRTLGATAMGTMGIGGMMVASSLSEQKSDADAEMDMTAYLATFKCDYGAGMNIRGGQTNVELPGASELIPLYAEYVALANDLKARKAQLGLKSGIESEKILDSATTGLYDDVSTGISSGAYASLSRALQNPDGEDAKKWAEQKDKTAQNLKTGAITAGVGAVVGIAGNAINQGVLKKKEKAKPAAVKELEQALANKTPSTAACPSQATGTHPNCICNSNKEYDRNSNACRECTGGRTVQVTDGIQQCVCADGETFDSATEKCVKTETVPACDTDAGEQLQGGQCVKVTSPEEETPATPTSPTKETFSGNLSAELLFEIGKSNLRSDVKEDLNAFAEKLKVDGYKNCTDVKFYGFTDTTGSRSRNLTLSKQRAQAVADYLYSLADFKAVLATGTQPTAQGNGEDGCKCSIFAPPSGKENDADYKYCKDKLFDHVVPDGTPYAPCRRVWFSMTCENESGVWSALQESGLSGGLSDGFTSALKVKK